LTDHTTGVRTSPGASKESTKATLSMLPIGQSSGTVF